MHPDGSCQLLDQATDPPLGARPEHVPRPQAGTAYHRGDTLARCVSLDPETLADTLLNRLGASHGARDDIALVVVRL